MSTGEISLILLIIILVMAALALAWYLFMQYRRRMSGAPDHVDLYFQDHFSDIASEWDLMGLEATREWKADISSRLGDVGTRITSLKKGRSEIDRKIVQLETKLSMMEEQR